MILQADRSGMPLSSVSGLDKEIRQEDWRVRLNLASPLTQMMLANKAMLQRESATRSRENSERQGRSKAAPAGRELSITHRVLNSTGESLDSSTKDFFEPRFGHDFSQVRVHTDSEAAASVREVEASAYTVGGHLVFASGRYEPHSRQGRELIAHELTHTIQQNHAIAVNGQLAVGPSDESENEADRAASVTVNGGRVAIQSHRPLSVQRQPSQAAGPNLNLAESASPFMAAAIGSLSIDAFQTGKADLSGANQAKVAKTAKSMQTLLRQYPGSTVRVIGHTDAVGQESDNQTLGQARADSVRDALLGAGVPPEIVQTESHGATDLLVKTKSAEPRNRRVEVRFEQSRPFKGVMSSGLTMGPSPTPDLRKLGPVVTADICTQSPNLCPAKPGGPPPVPPLALQPLPSLVPFHLMDVQALNQTFTSHGNRPEVGGDLRETWARLYSKYRWTWKLSEELAAKAANSELESTASTSESRDYPTVQDRFNTEIKEAYPNATTVGPFNLPLKWRF